MGPSSAGLRSTAAGTAADGCAELLGALLASAPAFTVMDTPACLAWRASFMRRRASLSFWRLPTSESTGKLEKAAHVPDALRGSMNQSAAAVLSACSFADHAAEQALSMVKPAHILREVKPENPAICVFVRCTWVGVDMICCPASNGCLVVVVQGPPVANVCMGHSDLLGPCILCFQTPEGILDLLIVNGHLPGRLQARAEVCIIVLCAHAGVCASALHQESSLLTAACMQAASRQGRTSRYSYSSR